MGCGDVFGKLNRFVPEFVVEHSRQPSLREQADHVGCSVDALQYYLAHIHGVGSLDAPAKAMTHEPGSKLLDLIANTHASGEASLDKLEADVDYSALSVTMQQLDDKERIVLEHRYQLGGADYLTLAQVGEKIGVCRERVRQLEQKAIRKLRGYMRHQPINFRAISIPVETYTEQLELEVAA
jgi:RNA polymerase primary sigma factor